MKIDFWATLRNYIDHMEPIYWGLSKEHRGQFIVQDGILLSYAKAKGIPAIILANYRRLAKTAQTGPLVVATPKKGGPQKLLEHRRKVVLINHGAGQSWRDSDDPTKYIANATWAGSVGRSHYAMILEPGDGPAQADMEACPNTIVLAIGCPRMDKWHPPKPKPKGEPPVVAIGFHHNVHVCPEALSAYEHYKDVLPELVEWAKTGEIKLLGTGHPTRWESIWLPLWKRLRIEPVFDFDEIMKRADVYVRDQHSTLYEFASLDRPVVVLNAPWYRRDVEHGIRFWEHADVGIQCDEPGDLIPAIKLALEDPPEQRELRHKAVAAVYKYADGRSTERAVEALLALLGSIPEAELVTAEAGRHIDIPLGKSVLKFPDKTFPDPRLTVPGMI